MTARQIRDMPASVHSRLLRVARERGEELQRLLVRYALERFLYRLGRSQHSQRFVLKGAMLFQVWEGGLPRTTRDLDLLGVGDEVVPAAEEIDYPTLLDFPAPQVWAYPKATVVAEKTQVMIELGRENTMKAIVQDEYGSPEVLGVGGSIDHPHATGADSLVDLVVGNGLPDHRFFPWQ